MERASEPATLGTPGSLGAQFPGAVAAIRWATAVVTAAVIAAAFWLTIMQEGHTGRILDHRWTDHDFPDSLGNLLGATDPARTGLAATVVLGVVIVLLFALLEPVLPGRGWVKGLAFSPIVLLLWGLVFCPLVDSRQILEGEDYVYLPTAVFARGSGRGTIISAVVASIVVGVVIARVLQLVRDAEWWREREATRQIMVVDRGGGRVIAVPDQRLDQLSPDAPGASLELTEERGDERGKRPG